MNIPELQTKLAALPGKLVDEIILQRLGLGAVAIIRKRTLEGQFLEGSSPDASQYSSKPFPIPLGLLKNKVSKTELKDKEKYVIFQAKSGSTWVVVMGGYKFYRKLGGRQNDHVDLSWSGRMLSNMGITEMNQNGLTIGFSREENQKLALWHNVLGAGKSHRKHVFFDLTEEERKKFAKYAGEEITKLFLQSLK